MSRGRESWGRGVDGEVAADSGRIQTQSAEEKMLDERLLLEDLDHALARGATPLAIVTGSGNASDAHHLTAPHPEARGA